MAGYGRAFVRHLSLLRERPVVAVMWLVFVTTFGFETAAPALPQIASTLGVSDARVGLLMTAFVVPAAVVLPVTGPLADLYGRRRVLLPAIVLFGVAGTAIAFVDTFRAIVLLRLLQGVAFAALAPIPVAILGDLYRGAEGAAAQGFRVSAAGIAMATVPVVAGALAELSWSYPFLLHLVAFPVAVLVYFVLPESFAGEGNDVGSSLSATLRTYATELRREITEPDIAILVVGGFLRGFVDFALLTFVPLYAARTLGASLTLAGAALVARGIVRTVVPPFAGTLTASLSRKHAMLLSIVLISASPALVLLAPSVLVIGILVGVYTVGDAIFSPLLKDTVTGRVTDERRAGVVNGMYVFQFGASALAPALLGAVLAVGGFVPLFLVTALTPLLYAPLLYRYL